MRPAPGATSGTAGASSAQQGVSSSLPVPFAALAACLGPFPRSPSTQVHVWGQPRRPQDRDFLQGSADYMARSPRTVFTLNETMAVKHSSRALLLELPEERLLSVGAAWYLVRADTWEGQRLSEAAVALVTSLRNAHGHCSLEVIWPTPEQDHAGQQRRALARGRDNNCGDRDRGDGGGRKRRDGGSSLRPGGGGHSGGGRGRESDNNRRNGGGGGGYGGGTHGRRDRGSGKGIRGKGGPSHLSSGGHLSSAYGTSSCSSSEDGG